MIKTSRPLTKAKTLAATGVVALTALAASGCSPVSHTIVPGYTARERDVEIARNISLEGSVLVDDFDKHVLMWRPVTQLSYWNLRQMSP